jgi:hypothetical protein
MKAAEQRADEAEAARTKALAQVTIPSMAVMPYVGN